MSDFTPIPNPWSAYTLSDAPTAAGASSTSRDGYSAGSIDAAADPDRAEALRQQALQSLAGLDDNLRQAQAGAPTPPRPSISLAEAAGLALLGGLMNRASPYSSEGTKALDTFLEAKQSQAQDQYNAQLDQHRQNVADALQAYRAGGDTAREMFGQASKLDDRAWQQRIKDEEAARQAHEDATERLWREQMDDDPAQPHDPLGRVGAVKRFGLENLSHSTFGRWLLGYHRALEAGLTPDKARASAQQWAERMPKDVQDELGQLLDADRSP